MRIQNCWLGVEYLSKQKGQTLLFIFLHSFWTWDFKKIILGFQKFPKIILNFVFQTFKYIFSNIQINPNI